MEKSTIYEREEIKRAAKALLAQMNYTTKPIPHGLIKDSMRWKIIENVAGQYQKGWNIMFFVLPENTLEGLRGLLGEIIKA